MILEGAVSGREFGNNIMVVTYVLKGSVIMKPGTILL